MSAVSAGRRRIVFAGLAIAAAGAGLRSRGEERVVKVVAKRFEFMPSTLELAKGEPVTIELTTLDVFMGFAVPDFKVRADIVPGKVQRLRFTPDKAGTFTFLCDVFCGDGHESMSGTLVVR